MNEFDTIAKYFRPLTNGDTLQDDAAVLKIPPGHELVITSDTLNAGTHFLENERPAHIARKALRSNLSDLAAMGAEPLCYQLNLAFPKPPDEDWLAEFSKALLTENKYFKIFCSGGDTTSINGGFLSISITALGLVPTGKALHRCGAKDGDKIILTGPIGDAYLGLRALCENLDYPEAIHRYRTPHPRLQIASMRVLVHAAADISDGLLADLGHIATASNLAANITLQKFIFTGEVMSALRENIITPQEVLTGGDDYELILSVAPEHEKVVIGSLQKMDIHAFTIGTFTPGQGIHVLDAKGQPMTFQKSGWTHF